MKLSESTIYANAQTREKYWNSPAIPAQVKDAIRELMETVEHQAKIVDLLAQRLDSHEVTIETLISPAPKHIRPADHHLGSVEVTL